MKLAPRPIGYFNRRHQFVAALPRRYGVGATTGQVFIGPINGGSSDYQAAATALYNELTSTGCQQASDPLVTAYQNAWNAAGASPTLVVDGLYGGNTAGALGTFNAAAPAGCVANAATGTVTQTPPPASSTPASSVSVDTGSTDVIPLAIAAVVGAGLIGWAVYAKKGYRWRTRHAHR